MSIETQEQALAEARKRWGPKAAVNANLVYSTFYVGGNWFIDQPISGYGDSWDAAFADADNRSRKQDV